MEILPEPSVSADIYDDTYYREWCAGYPEWNASGGAQVAGIYPGFLIQADLRPGEVVVDMGTGRGELLVTAIERGAERAFGVEYSPSAVNLAEQTIDAHGLADRVELVLADARSTPLPSGIADLVCFVDVVEHLTPDELHAALSEARRLLRPGGRAVAHTMPNRLTYDVTYRLLRPLIGRSWPKDPRNSFEHSMHVNEQTLRSLRQAFAGAGFDVEVKLGSWIRDDSPPSARVQRLYRAAARVRPLAQFVVSDLWAIGRVRAG